MISNSIDEILRMIKIEMLKNKIEKENQQKLEKIKNMSDKDLIESFKNEPPYFTYDLRSGIGNKIIMKDFKKEKNEDYYLLLEEINNRGLEITK